MLNCLLVADSNGLPFYSKTFNNFKLEDDTLLSGLISAIGSVGSKLFKKEIATINFGTGKDSAQIMVVTRELFSAEKTINFVFFVTGDFTEVQIKTFRELATTLFMDAKNFFRGNSPEIRILREKIDKVIMGRFQTLATL